VVCRAAHHGRNVSDQIRSDLLVLEVPDERSGITGTGSTRGWVKSG
jgi:hypothetical protein